MSLCENMLVSQCTRVAVQSRRPNTVAAFYLAARQSRQKLLTTDRLLPADPSKLVTKTTGFKETSKKSKQASRSAQAATLFGRIIAPAHTAKLSWIRSRAQQLSTLSLSDQQCLLTLEHRTQSSAKGGSCRFFSAPPVSHIVRVTDYEYRFAVTNVLGNEPKALHSTAQGARCPKCPSKPRIKDGRHFHNCMLSGRSAVHNAVRDTTARITRAAVGPHVSIVPEPRGNVVGCASDHRGGPDMVVIDSRVVIDFKSTNPNAKRNQTKLARDIKAHLRNGSAAASGPGSQDHTDLSRNQSEQIEHERLVPSLIAETETGQDAEAAHGVGLNLICVPVSTVAAVHGKLWDAIAPAIEQDDEADQRCTIGWSITDARSMLFQATVMATVRSAADNALRCARGVCLDAHMRKPDISHSAWPPPSSSSRFDYNLDGDLEAMCSDHHGAETTSHPSLPNLGDQSITVADIEFQSQSPSSHRDTSADDVAGPAQTLHDRFHTIRSPANN